MKHLRVGLFITITTYLLFVIFANRGLLFSKFDAPYWKDKYEHSQWKLPLSTRTIGDDGLYAYQGYALVHGGDPSLFNAEVPPLGKYLIGWTTILFGNPYWFGIIVNLSVLLCIFFLTKHITQSMTMSLLTVLLLATDPLFTNQYALTMLDSLQALFLLLYCLFVFKNQPLLAGVSLGFFAETKFPLLLPIPFILGGWHLWKNAHSIRPLILLIIGLSLGYLLPYSGYFLQGHTIFDWLKIQKWIISFYLSSGIHPTYGSALINLVAGSFQNIFSRAWQTSSHWSPVWPLLIISVFYGLFFWKNKSAIRFIILLTFGIFCVYMIIPFWTRYLILILPLLYSLLTYMLKNLKPKLFTMLAFLFVATNILWSWPTFFPTPESMFSLFTYSWSNNIFSDMYEDVTFDRKNNWDRTSFHEFGLNTVYDGEIEKTTISYTLPRTNWLTKQVSIPVKITYTTRHLGSFDVESVIPLIKENNRWKVQWEWSMFVPQLSPNTRLKTLSIEGKRGDIVAKDKTKLAYDFPSHLVWVTPNNVEQTEESRLLLFLEKIFEQKIRAVHIHQRIFGNTLSSRPIPIGVVPKTLNSDEMATLLAFKGVTLTSHLGRQYAKNEDTTIGLATNTSFVECCSLLYSASLYDGTSGLENTYNTLLKGENGGTLQIVNDNNQILQTFIKKTKKDGNNVQL